MLPQDLLSLLMLIILLGSVLIADAPRFRAPVLQTKPL